MAAAALFGPAQSSPSGRLSISTSSRSSTSSSESPRTGTSFTFSVRYMDEGSRASPRSPNGDIVPKIEEIDEDDDAIDTKIEPFSDEGNEGSSLVSPSVSSSNLVARRPRGRPRKHPKTPILSNGKAPKGRSKTGCITCRRRKKKCDETKPACMLQFKGPQRKITY